MLLMLPLMRFGKSAHTAFDFWHSPNDKRSKQNKLLFATGERGNEICKITLDRTIRMARSVCSWQMSFRRLRQSKWLENQHGAPHFRTATDSARWGTPTETGRGLASLSLSLFARCMLFHEDLHADAICAVVAAS